MKYAFALFLFGSPLAAQQAIPVSSWVTELGAGAGTDLFARGPWIAPSWRHSFTHRVGLTVGLSIAYEIIERWNGQTNSLKASDVGQRLVGTLALEALWRVCR